MIPDSPLADTVQALKEEREVMTAYSDAAKTCMQLSSGALALSVTFVEKVRDAKVAEQHSPWLYAAWVCWLLAVVSSAAYQYLAVRFLEARGQHWGLLSRSGHRQLFRKLANHPSPVYGCMLLAFALGAVCFVVYGIQR